MIAKRRLFILALVACSCTKAPGEKAAGSKDNANSASNGKAAASPPADEGGSVDTVEAVPISLLDVDALTTLGSSLNATKSIASIVGPPFVDTVTAQAISTAQQGLGVALAAAPIDGLAEVARTLDEIQTATSRLKDANVKGPTIPVSISKGKGTARFKPPAASGARWLLELSVDLTGAPSKAYTFDFYNGAASGGLERVTHYVTVLVGDAKTTTAATIMDVEDTAAGRTFIRAEQSNAGKALATDFGSYTDKTSAFRREIFRATIADPTTPGVVTGVRSWRSRSHPALIYPAYYAPADGDIQTCGVVYQSLTDGIITAAIGFIPDAKAKPVTTTGVDFFNSWAYALEMNDFIIKISRDPAVNASCSTTGDAFRTGLAGGTVPATVAALPANVCATNSTLADDAFITALADLCTAGGDVSIAAALGDGAQTATSLCGKRKEGVLMFSPAYYKFSGGIPSNVDAKAVTPEMVKLSQLIIRPTDADLNAVNQPPDFDVPKRPATDFADAKELQ